MPIDEYFQQLNRRHFLSKMGLGIGSMALGSMMGCQTETPLIKPSDNPLAGILNGGAFCT